MNQPLKIIAAISVLLNLLLVGIIFGHAGQYFIGSRMHRSLQEIADSLPADKRQLFETSMHEVEQDTDALHAQLNDARQESTRILKAEPFDRKAYMNQVQRIQKLRAQMMHRMAEAVADLAAQCTLDERVKLAEVIRNQAPAPGAPVTSQPVAGQQ